ncbi:MAG: short-chain dehydrogenase [Rhodanobacter sp. 68-29]|nr:NnrS family protein [Rhodanobacter sp.]ODU74053.1 MAG: short-chain dehydrogenase [Rhodanobacter sp. SCN 69-32]OJY55410.1 MAG: short-chain dehydrogenase [Rhodanobacter sp. 68-29]
MDTSTSPAVASDPAALLAAAPHRPLFLAGTVAVLLTMTWWTLELASLRFGWARWPQPTVPPVWGHAVLIQYGLFPLFMFGFLMTTFPRWMDGPSVPPVRYLPVAGGVLGGYVLGTLGLLGQPTLLKLGLVLMLAGYLAGVGTLAQVMAKATDRNKHGWSCLAAFGVGTLGLAAFVVWLFDPALPAALGWLSVKLGTFGFLLPVYFTVCHRMLPFFSKNMVAGYVMWRPVWSLPVVWALLLAHVLLDWAALPQWLWVCDLPLAAVFALHWLMWKPWRCLRPGLLAVLHIAFAWLPLAFVLYSVQDLAFALRGEHVLGLAPLHALAIGFFGSMLVAMVTRVTHGHSGRPLQMHPVPWLCFALLQLVAFVRIRAELGGDRYLWLVIAGAGWLLAFLPWVLRSAWIYLTPRTDGRPG